MAQPLLEVRGVSKTFPGLRALDDVSFEVRSGEVVALVGQNGSGKSTLVKALTGIHEPDPGSTIRVRLGGGPLVTGPAARAELQVIHQDLGLIGGLSTVENLDLGSDHRRRWLLPVSHRRERDRARELIARFGGAFDVTAPVAELAPAERTLVAIARAVGEWDRPDKVLILDEPTAALHGAEVERLFAVIRRLTAAGAGVLFISHRLDEVMELADRVIALRGGRKVADVRADACDHDGLVTMIAGRDPRRARRATSRGTGAAPRLVVRGLAGSALDGVDLDVAGGEVVGISGLIGSGREHLCRLLFGASARTAGEVLVEGAPVPAGSPRVAIAMGMGYVPADRHADGAVLRMSARENLTLPHLSPLCRRHGAIDSRAELAEARSWADRLALSPPEPDRPLELFSGGNQQKVVLAKWLRLRPNVLLLDEPTQGVDIAAKEAIYELIADAAAAGAAVVVASSDEKELSQLCDRVVVLRDGRPAGEIGRVRLSEATLVLENLGLAEGPASPAACGGHA